MKTIYIRTISGAVFISLIIVSVLFSKFAIGGVLAVAAFICVQELLNILNSKGKKISGPVTVATVALIFVGFSLSLSASDERFLFPIVALAFLIPFIHQIIWRKDASFESALIASATAIYIAVPMILLVQSGIINGYYYPFLLLGIFLLTWTYDTFAYLFGISIGKHRLLERISPKKSVEGLIGGAAVTIFGAWLYSTFNDDLSLMHWLIIAMIIVVFGTLGDLCESMIKRNFNVKDSGGIMPGHGGLLDRFDGLLFIAPAVYCYLAFVLN